MAVVCDPIIKIGLQFFQAAIDLLSKSEIRFYMNGDRIPYGPVDREVGGIEVEDMVGMTN